MVSRRILMVDDEPRVLDGLRRSLHGRYDLTVATSGAEGLARVRESETPYAVIVSDMRMPGMDGAQFLTEVRRIAPDSVQMILSGQAELSSTIEAVNNANLFRFLTKPCETPNLTRALDAALSQYQLIHSERELLEHTLDGSIQVLIEVMSATNATAFNRTENVKLLTGAVATATGLTDTWELRLAAMLGQLGLLAVPPEVLTAVAKGVDLSPETQEIYHGHPRLAHDLIRRIPRLERVSEWVAGQPVWFDETLKPPTAAEQQSGSEPPGTAPGAAQPDDAARDGQAAGCPARDIYDTVMAFVLGVESGRSPGTVVRELAATGRYPRRLLDATLAANSQNRTRRPRQLPVSQLAVGMLVEQDVLTRTGLTLVRSGDVLTESMVVRLRHFANGIGVVEPVNVLA